MPIALPDVYDRAVPVGGTNDHGCFGPLNSQELAASSLAAERLSCGLGSERAATAAGYITAAQLHSS